MAIELIRIYLELGTLCRLKSKGYTTTVQELHEPVSNHGSHNNDGIIWTLGNKPTENLDGNGGTRLQFDCYSKKSKHYSLLWV